MSDSNRYDCNRRTLRLLITLPYFFLFPHWLRASECFLGERKQFWNLHIWNIFSGFWSGTSGAWKSHLILTTNKKLNKQKHQQSGGKLLPPKLERWTGKCREITSYRAGAHSQKPLQEPVLGWGNLNEELWEAQSGWVWELKTADGCGCTLFWVLELNASLSPTPPHHTTKGDLPEFLYPVHHDQLSTKNYKAY